VSTGFGFELVAEDGAARVGRLRTPHGSVDTPAFMPVATYGGVRLIGPDDLAGLGAQIVLANAYHLHERPGEQTVAKLGGLHGFTGWRGPWLTDSGGYQILSLGDRRKIDEDGVTFRSPVDGTRRRLTPESVVAIQEALGPDVAMALDECAPVDAEPSAARAAMERTLRWAERAAAARTRPDQWLFGIVQGGQHAALRRESARATASLGFDGHAHGGLGLGEEPARRAELVAEVNALLPKAQPRYLMGLGRPEDVVAAVARGVDLFDCVLPTRHGRHGVLFTHEGLLHVKNAAYKEDPRPPDPQCECPVCARHSRAYLRHLLHAHEQLGGRLGSLHNLHFYLRLLEGARAAIREGRFETWASGTGLALP
jgi:queuine tRNA-ribosyltransferase